MEKYTKGGWVSYSEAVNDLIKEKISIILCFQRKYFK